jgi:hypothetical protein
MAIKPAKYSICYKLHSGPTPRYIGSDETGTESAAGKTEQEVQCQIKSSVCV